MFGSNVKWLPWTLCARRDASSWKIVGICCWPSLPSDWDTWWAGITPFVTELTILRWSHRTIIRTRWSCRVVVADCRPTVCEQSCRKSTRLPITSNSSANTCHRDRRNVRVLYLLALLQLLIVFIITVFDCINKIKYYYYNYNFIKMSTKKQLKACVLNIYFQNELICPLCSLMCPLMSVIL